jgi:hypothetical protein
MLMLTAAPPEPSACTCQRHKEARGNSRLFIIIIIHCAPAVAYVPWALAAFDLVPSTCRYASIKSFVIGFLMTFFSVFDVPVFWPILLMYWMILFFVTMKRQIKHMIKYKYLPFTTGKKVGGHCSSTAV